MIVRKITWAFFLMGVALFPAAAGGGASGGCSAESLFAALYSGHPFSLKPLGQAEFWNALRATAALSPEFCEVYDPHELIPLLQSQVEKRTPKEMRTRMAFQEGAVKKGEKVLLYAEKGLGDTLMWIRYVPQLMTRYPDLDITVQIQKPLMCLKDMLGDGAKDITFVVDADPKSDEYNYYLSLFELPFVLDAPLPDGKPYLTASPLNDAAKTQMDALARGRLKVGICFRGAKDHPCNEQRSVPLDAFMPLIDRSDACVFSLQIGDGQERVKDFPQIVDLSPHLKSIADTAAYINNLDLVITIDSMIGHLAGALGVPTIMLLCEHPDFRWACGTEDATPWYRNHVLARQNTEEKWAAVTSRALEEYPLFKDKGRSSSTLVAMQLL